MQFDNIPVSPYLNIVLEIIRNGIKQSVSKLEPSENEGLKNQFLADTFNYLGTTNEKVWIGAGKENISKGKQAREDIYFYLNDDDHTRIFYVEGKRLPKHKTQTKEEYVVGINSYGHPCGGIERFKKGMHGDSSRILNNGLIAYIENNSMKYWVEKINRTIQQKYNPNEIMIKKDGFLMNIFPYTSLIVKVIPAILNSITFG